jgi:rhodanese-related sulfurtransferase
MALRAGAAEAGAALTEFLKKKEQVDASLASLETDFQGIVCGVTGNDRVSQSGQLPLSSTELRRRLSAGTVQVIDIREPQEHALFHEWSVVGLQTPPRNVPLSRFVNFMREMLVTEGALPVVLLCRSGGRSQQAAKTLRRMGLNQIYSLDGGVALL